jgi:hypothetical protein
MMDDVSKKEHIKARISFERRVEKSVRGSGNTTIGKDPML